MAGGHGFSGAGRVLGKLVGPRVKWLVVVVAVLVSAAAFAFAGEAKAVSTTAASLPDSAEAAQVTALREQLPSSGVTPAIVVYKTASGEIDTKAVAASRDRAVVAVEQWAPTGAAAGGAPASAIPPQVSQDKSTALVIVPLKADLPDQANSDAVAALRAAVRDGLPQGLTATVTGGPAFGADIGAVFDGADIKLLGATAGVVAILLLITYRSPWLWLVPLTVVGIGDQVASKAADDPVPHQRGSAPTAPSPASPRSSSSVRAPTTPCSSSPATARSCAAPRTATTRCGPPSGRPRRRSWPSVAP